MNNMIFAYPQFFWLLLVLPVMIAWYIFKQKKANATIQVSSLKGFEISGSSNPIVFVLFPVNAEATTLG